MAQPEPASLTSPLPAPCTGQAARGRPRRSPAPAPLARPARPGPPRRRTPPFGTPRCAPSTPATAAGRPGAGARDRSPHPGQPGLRRLPRQLPDRRARRPKATPARGRPTRQPGGAVSAACSTPVSLDRIDPRDAADGRRSGPAPWPWPRWPSGWPSRTPSWPRASRRSASAVREESWGLARRTAAAAPAGQPGLPARSGRRAAPAAVGARSSLRPGGRGFPTCPTRTATASPRSTAGPATDLLPAAAVALISEDYAGKPLSPAEVHSWAHKLASYWYPSYNTDLAGSGPRWPDDETEAEVRGPLGDFASRRPRW